MNSTENNSKIIQQISEIIGNGFVLDRSASHFILSSFSVSTPEELEQVIADDDSDIDVIYELVVAPDKIIQESLELFLCEACFSKEDEQEIIKHLCGKNLDSKIIFPDQCGVVTITPDEYLIERFTHKLRMTVNPDRVVYKASEELTEQTQLKTLVRLRNSTIKYDLNITQFITDFFHNESIGKEDFSALFDFSITLLEENSGKLDILDFFILKKRSYEKTLGTIRQVNKQLKTSAVETMMMQGVRLPPESKEDIELRLQMSETILAVFFGYIDSHDDKPAEIHLGNIPSSKEIKKVFRILS